VGEEVNRGDGQRFLINTMLDTDTSAIDVVVNWTGELEER